jgi:serine/threonine protein kinase
VERRDDRSFSSSSASNRGPQPLRVLESTAASSARAASAPSRLSEPPKPDATIGRYALHTEIASGGMATIHIGRLLGPVGFARTVAIKRLHPQFAKDPEFVAMFLDEARLTARIRHPNVVSTLDVVATDGELFVVMEYVAGESLARLLRIVRGRKEPVPVPIAAAIMVDVLHGLHAAHEARDESGEPLNIVHRDVSPHNILVGTDGAAHLIDFGIAKARGRSQVTREGEIKGKLSYMPPEQLLGHALDHRADVFAASIVFWEALTGRRLFQGTDDGDILAKVLLGQVEKPSLYVSKLSRAADEIVLRGLARERSERYATARDMALAIEGAMPLAPPSQVGSWVERLAGEDLADRTYAIANVEGGLSATESARVPALPAPDQTHRRVTGVLAAGNVEPRPRMEPTEPTVPLGARVRSTMGSGSSSARNTPPALAADDSLAAVAGVSGSSRRGAVMAVSLLVASAVLAVSAVRGRSHRTAATERDQAATQVVNGHTAAPPPAPRPQPATDWVPVPPSTPTTEEVSLGDIPTVQPAPVSKPAGVVRKPTTRSPPGPRSPGSTRSSAPSETGSAATSPPPGAPDNPSCDPPYWTDPDGNKRYYRHCDSH